MRGIFLAALLLATLAVPATAQVKKQVFFGAGATAARVTGTPAIPVSGGFALVVPLNKRIFLRPVAAGGFAKPTVPNKSAFPTLQTGGMIGFRASQNFAVLVGGAETFTFPAGKPVSKLPTLIFSSATKISKHCGVFTPVTINARGVSASIQFGYTW